LLQNQINGVGFYPSEVMSMKCRLGLVEEEMASLSGLMSEERKLDLIQSLLAEKAVHERRFDVRLRMTVLYCTSVTARSKDEACDRVCERCDGDCDDLEILEVREVRA
jgi:hypothetical protein